MTLAVVFSARDPRVKSAINENASNDNSTPACVGAREKAITMHAITVPTAFNRKPSFSPRAERIWETSRFANVVMAPGPWLS